MPALQTTGVGERIFEPRKPRLYLHSGQSHRTAATRGFEPAFKGKFQSSSARVQTISRDFTSSIRGDMPNEDGEVPSAAWEGCNDSYIRIRFRIQQPLVRESTNQPWNDPRNLWKGWTRPSYRIRYIGFFAGGPALSLTPTPLL